MQDKIDNKIKKLKTEIKDLEERMPAHSININMMNKLEELKLELKEIQMKKTNND
ncbi:MULTISPECIES: histidine kinase [unclassified Candidatus Frackibacter]|uniref:histidine kinase n=1 Tax=unclassified Candidatus Frackibacter TaxID=2648818 RepID=UPI000885E1F1|nr:MULTISPECIES: histidine kinase [unclassified Candidatus Frackibacter]SDC27275.1 hypothetical protein SAMN04515661_10565 [Candidatus Frackibacter sp. WG11]SEM54255.1 hypothetical protein SAMN04488698_10666 [Candidatus Frackibacter sp. WG12]SFL54145.1 hypothetical protein SAMN04488699_10528 [Candidatus Frackibacter sp. WG13]